MSIVKAASLEALRTALNASFKKGFESAQTNHEEITMVVPSTSKSNTYGWLGAMASVREWLGDRVVNSLKEHSYTIENKVSS